jgi:hypothetical protein
VSGRTVLVGAAVAALVAVVVFLGGGRPGPSGPPSSSYATTPDGLAAWAALLERAGHDVRRIRGPLDKHPIPQAQTVVLVDGSLLPARERRALATFVRGGGRAVLAGPAAVDALGAALPSGRAPVRERRGRGELTLLGDAGPLRNRALGRGANAALALMLAGAPARRVAFVESVHGYHEARGLGALPSGLRWCLGLLGLAALVGIVARGRRLGPPEAEADEPAPARRAHVDALAAALARTRDREQALPVAARRAGLSEDETLALTGAATTKAEAR